jgi:hypothetical protein
VYYSQAAQLTCTVNGSVRFSADRGFCKSVLRIRIRIRIRIHMFLGLPDPDPLVRGIDPKNLDSYYFVTFFLLFIFEK